MNAIVIKRTHVRIPANILKTRPYAREAAYLMNYAEDIGETEYSLTFRDYLYNGEIGNQLLAAAGTISLVKATDKGTRLRASRLRRFAFEALH